MKKKLIGYLVHRPETDEFLFSIDDSNDIQITGWIKSDPGSAYRFPSLKLASDFCIEDGKSSIPVLLYDRGSTYLVTFPDVRH